VWAGRIGRWRGASNWVHKSLGYAALALSSLPTLPNSFAQGSFVKKIKDDLFQGILLTGKGLEGKT